MSAKGSFTQFTNALWYWSRSQVILSGQVIILLCGMRTQTSKDSGSCILNTEKLWTKSKLCFSSNGTLALSWFYYPHHHKNISLWDSLKTIHWLQERGLNLLSKYHGGYAMYTCLCTTWHYHLEAERCQRISLLVFATFSSYLCA